MTNIWEDENIKPGNAKRVDEKHPGEFYWMVDERNRKGLWLQSKSELAHKKIASLAGIACNIEKSDDSKLDLTIIHDLEPGEAIDDFFNFCEFLVNVTYCLKGTDDVFREVINKLDLWNKLFRTKSDGLLTENEILGLFGELLFIKEFLEPIIGIENAISSWEDGEQDFQFNKKLYEIKTSSMAKDRKIQISSLDQLNTQSGDIFICRQTLGKMNSKDDSSDSLNGIVKEINKIIDKTDNPNLGNLYSAKLYERRYEEDIKYEKFFLNLQNRQFIRVTNDFPKLTPQNVDPRVKSVSYEIEEISYSKFIIDEEEASQYLRTSKDG